MEQQHPDVAAVNQEGEALAALLGIEEAPGKKKKRSRRKKRLFLLLGGIAALLLTAVGVWALFFQEKDADTASVYREYTVERGDVVVGQNESSSISLNRITVTFPVSAEVLEVYVKAGSSVKAGDPLVRLDAEDVAEGLKSYELQLEVAALELEQAKLQQQTKLLQAEQTLESSELTGNLAGATAELTVAELEANVAKAEKEYQDAAKMLEDYCQLNLTYASDYNALQAAKNNVTYYTNNATTLKAAESSLSAAEAVLDANKATSSQSKLSAVYVNYPTVIQISGVNYTDLKAVLEAWDGTDNAPLTQTEIKTAVESYYPGYTASAIDTDLTSAFSCYKDIKSAKAVLASSSYGSASAAQSAIAQNAANLTSATEQYTLLNTNFKEKYGTASDEDDLAELAENAKTALASAQLSLEKAQLSEKTGKTTAEQKKDTSVNAADTASTTYELTVMELKQAVDTAQEAYNDLLKQIEDVKEVVSDDGVVYAEASGMVSAVSVAVGDTLSVFVDEDTHKIMNVAQLLTMTDIADVYVPITISEEDILSVSIGQRAEVTMTAFPGRTFAAEVDTISVESSRSGAATVSYTVNVKFSEENELDLYEGMSAEVTLIQRAAKDVLYINTQAVTNTDGVATVLVPGDDGTPVSQEVTTGFSDGRYVELLSGLSEGDTVLVESAVGRG